MLLLSKLDWDMSAVIASDFVEHIIQRVCRLHQTSSSSPLCPAAAMEPGVVRSHSEALITMCSAHHSFSGLSASLVAAACVLTTIRPILEQQQQQQEKEERRTTSTEAPPVTPVVRTRPPSLETVMEAVERFTLIDKVAITLTLCANIHRAVRKEEGCCFLRPPTTALRSSHHLKKFAIGL